MNLKMLSKNSKSKFPLPYGNTYIEINLPFKHLDFIYPPVSNAQESDEIKLVMDGLRKPITSNENSIDFSGKEIALSINDTTRPIPYQKILPPLIDYLVEKGADTSKISYYIATGTHRPLSREEINAILPIRYVKNSKVICHNCDDYQKLEIIGKTRSGTPVSINAAFLQADIKIVTGNIEPHHFMGYSGGVKPASIGLAGRETIEKNHGMLLDPMARIGTCSSNPMRRDVEEIGKMISVDFAFNIVQNYNKTIEACIFGDPQQVMLDGITVSRRITQISNSKKYDLVIASPGGYPKDINLYQSQKAISNACLFTKENGVIIVLAACIEGSGNKDLEVFLNKKKSRDELIMDFISYPFRLGPHKAYQLALQSMHHHIILVSTLPEIFLEKLPVSHAGCFEEGLSDAIKIVGASPEVAILPYATHCIPAQVMDDINFHEVP